MTTYNSKSPNATEFIDHQEIVDSLAYGKSNQSNKALLLEILAKAKAAKGITHQEAALLLACEDPEILERMYTLAKEIKATIYGRRIVMFAPLYLANHCVNGCRYCPYHYENKNITRKKLDKTAIINEVTALQDMGHKRLALEFGEDPKNIPIEYVLDCIDTIYQVKHKNGAIRRVNVNIAATTVENYTKLRDAAIGTYILFQETYHKPTYEYVHPKGPKSNYAYHTEAMDRAMTGGIDDVGFGVLFGLYDYQYDFIGLLLHAKHLEDTFGVGPHTVSVPRIRPADDVDLTEFPYAITDQIFKKIVALLRIVLPYTGIIVSTRESEESRAAVLELGVSQISGASCTSVGGYVEKEKAEENSAQFEINDTRTLDEIVNWLLSNGHIPSFCTACYRQGRTGDGFMKVAKTGSIAKMCQANALMTLEEYIEDYASGDTQAKGKAMIAAELTNIQNPKIKATVLEYLSKLRAGERDFRV